jgi:hypothetical protein
VLRARVDVAQAALQHAGAVEGAAAASWACPVKKNETARKRR